MLDPLRLARLPGKHRDGVRRGGRVLGGEDVVEENEAVRILPEERDRVAIDVAHHEPRELRAHGRARSALRGVSPVLVRREPVHRHGAVGDVQLAGEALVAVVHAVHEG